MRAEYDLSKMKLIGRGIYAERFKKGVKFVLVDNDEMKERDSKKEDNDEPRNISNSTER